jgi:ferredoxin
MTAAEFTPTLIPAPRLQAVLDALIRRGWMVLGPVRADGAIAYGPVTSTGDLPEGWADAQDGGRYRLVHRDDPAWFGFAVGPHSWKRYLPPPAFRLFRAERSDGHFTVNPEADEPPRLALLGVRPCELAAIARQDKVFLGGPFTDPVYRRRRDRLFIMAVECTTPAATCFCASMGTGPGADAGYDLKLTELADGDWHEFVIVAGSRAGADILDEVDAKPAGPDVLAEAARRVDAAAAAMCRAMPLDARGVLRRQLEHPRWEEIAKRCLACGNCTMVCPTCFCTTVEDTTDLTGRTAERWRRWDSCFTAEFSYIHGGSVRRGTAARYRQWLTHKLASWHDQFGESGCVGCGRCITWCPVGIDLTAEVAAFRTADAASSP